MSISSNSSDNPYGSPAVGGVFARCSRLSRYQRRILKFYCKLQHSPPTMLGMILLSCRQWLLIAAIVAAFIYAASRWSGDRVLASLLTFALVPYVLGIITRDLSNLRGFVRMWPVLTDVFDWQKIQDRVKE